MCLYTEGQQATATLIADSVAGVVAGDEPDHQLTHVARAEDLATYYAWIGNATQSIQWVVKAYDLSPTGIDPDVLGSALFDRVRDEAVFSAALRGVLEGIWPLVLAARDSVVLSLAP